MIAALVILILAAALALPATLIALQSTRDLPALDRLARTPAGRALGLLAVPLLVVVLLVAMAVLGSSR